MNIEYMDLDFPEFQHGCFHKTSIYWFPKNFKGQRELYDSEIKAILDREGYIDYLALVNKENKLPDDWEDKLETVTIKNYWETIDYKVVGHKVIRKDDSSELYIFPGKQKLVLVTCISGDAYNRHIVICEKE